jgi:hypothetical protein
MSSTTISNTTNTTGLVGTNGETITVTSTGTIDTSNIAISFATTGDTLALLSNAGLIESTDTYAVLALYVDTILNTGTILGGAGDGNAVVDGVDSANTGLLSNSAAGLIENEGASTAVDWGAGTLYNAGRILGGTNGAGVYLRDSGTIENNGTIDGGPEAIEFVSDTASALILDPLSDIIGGVTFAGLTSSTVALLLGGSSSTETTLASDMPSASGTGSLVFEGFAAGAHRNVDLTAAELSGTTIDNFYLGNTLDIAGVGTETSFNFSSSSGLLTLSGGSSSVVVTLASADVKPDETFTLSGDGHGGTDVTDNVACFTAGTRLLGIDGEIAVEDISVGDVLVTVRHDGPEAGRVVWVGQRLVQISRHPKPDALRPVIIRAGAIAAGVPERDISLSPNHAVYLDGCLFEAASLVNGATIRRDMSVETVSYFHVELDRHDIVLADGLPAESYLDTGNRAMFAGDVMVLHADFASPPDAPFCAPLVREGARLDAVRARLAARALRQAA